jgi:hypothetical protein
LRLIRFWLRELSRIHFTRADAHHIFLNPDLVEALFPNEENICFSIGDFHFLYLQREMFPGIAGLTRIGSLNCFIGCIQQGVTRLTLRRYLTSFYSPASSVLPE